MCSLEVVLSVVRVEYRRCSGAVFEERVCWTCGPEWSKQVQMNTDSSRTVSAGLNLLSWWRTYSLCWVWSKHLTLTEQLECPALKCWLTYFADCKCEATGRVTGAVKSLQIIDGKHHLFMFSIRMNESQWY